MFERRSVAHSSIGDPVCLERLHYSNLLTTLEDWRVFHDPTEYWGLSQIVESAASQISLRVETLSFSDVKGFL